MAKNKPASRDYEAYLIERLKNPKNAAAYLQAALEDTEMPEVFLLALRHVAEAHGMAKVAKSAKLNRESLYRMLSKKGNPELGSLYALLNTLGFRLTVTTKTKQAA